MPGTERARGWRWGGNGEKNHLKGEPGRLAGGREGEDRPRCPPPTAERRNPSLTGAGSNPGGVLSSPGKLPSSPCPRGAPFPAVPTKSRSPGPGAKPEISLRPGVQRCGLAAPGAWAPQRQERQRWGCELRAGGGLGTGPAPPGTVLGPSRGQGRGVGSPRLLPRPAKGLAAGPRLGAAPRARPLAVPALARRPLGIFIPGICLV